MERKETSIDTQRVTRDLLTSIRNAEDEIPEEFVLFQNYPNPFNPTTTINFSIHNSQFSILKIYNALGKEVKTLLQEELAPGVYELKFNGSDLPSGIYFYRLTSGSFTQTHKMILLK